MSSAASQTLIFLDNFQNPNLSQYGHSNFTFPIFVNNAKITKYPRVRLQSIRHEAYKKIQLETAGAYQLVDEVTGEKVIVWGDTGDDIAIDTSPPPPETISRAIKGKSKPTLISGSIPSFDRLKVKKVKSLIKKSNVVQKTDDKGENFAEVAAVDNVDNIAESRVVSNSKLKGWSGSSNTSVVDDYVYKRDSRDGGRSRYEKKFTVAKDSGFFSRKNFKELGCSSDMLDALKKISVVRPSHIQAVAFAPVIQGKSCIIADQSGSGKTLAYLIPVIQRLRQEELEGLSKSLSRNPRVVVLVPTAELASQVLNNCRSISKNGVPFRSMVATGGFRQKTQLDSLEQELDVLIATPGRFIYLLQENFVKLDNLKCIVLDEVDILYGDEGFEQVLQSLIKSAPMEAQYLFVTATLPVDTYNKLVQVFPDCEVSMGPGIHRTSSRLEEVLVDCSGDGMEKNPETAFHNKKTALLRLAAESPVPKTIVFCNKIETCRRVENALNRFDRKGIQIKVLPFHAALAQEARLANMKEFLSSKSRDSMFLICTDRASRGIDFQNVDHVVLFDFPRDPSEYVRRVGRTARGAGGEGKAFVFVVGKQVSLASRIMERNKKGHPLHDVPSAYELESSILEGESTRAFEQQIDIYSLYEAEL